MHTVSLKFNITYIFHCCWCWWSSHLGLECEATPGSPNSWNSDCRDIPNEISEGDLQKKKKKSNFMCTRFCLCELTPSHLAETRLFAPCCCPHFNSCDYHCVSIPQSSFSAVLVASNLHLTNVTFNLKLLWCLFSICTTIQAGCHRIYK